MIYSHNSKIADFNKAKDKVQELKQVRQAYLSLRDSGLLHLLHFVNLQDFFVFLNSQVSFLSNQIDDNFHSKIITSFCLEFNLSDSDSESLGLLFDNLSYRFPVGLNLNLNILEIMESIFIDSDFNISAFLIVLDSYILDIKAFLINQISIDLKAVYSQIMFFSNLYSILNSVDLEVLDVDYLDQNLERDSVVSSKTPVIVNLLGAYRNQYLKLLVEFRAY